MLKIIDNYRLTSVWYVEEIMIVECSYDDHNKVMIYIAHTWFIRIDGQADWIVLSVLFILCIYSKIPFYRNRQYLRQNLNRFLNIL